MYDYCLVRRQFNKKKWIEISFKFQVICYCKTITEAKKIINQYKGE